MKKTAKSPPNNDKIFQRLVDKKFYDNSYPVTADKHKKALENNSSYVSLSQKPIS
jgi:hypothetical protein